MWLQHVANWLDTHTETIVAGIVTGFVGLVIPTPNALKGHKTAMSMNMTQINTIYAEARNVAGFLAQWAPGATQAEKKAKVVAKVEPWVNTELAQLQLTSYETQIIDGLVEWVVDAAFDALLAPVVAAEPAPAM